MNGKRTPSPALTVKEGSLGACIKLDQLFLRQAFGVLWESKSRPGSGHVPGSIRSSSRRKPCECHTHEQIGFDVNKIHDFKYFL